MSIQSLASATTTLPGLLPELRPRDADGADATRADDARAAREARESLARQPQGAAATAASPAIATDAAQRTLARASALGPLTYGRGAALAAAPVAARGIRLDVTA
jgi:hypothetical protein